MSIISRVLKQRAVYWAPDGFTENGQPAFASPVELNARWSGSIELNIAGTEDTSVEKSEVMVSVDLVPGGVLMLGTLADVVDELNPLNNPNAYEISRFTKTPNLKISEFLRIAHFA